MEVEAEDDDNEEEIEEEEESDVVEDARPLCVQCRDAYRMSFEEADALLLCRRDACLFCTDCNYHELLEDDRSFLMENALGKKLDRAGIYYARPANTDRELAFHAANYAEEKMKREGVHGWSISVWQRWAEPVDNTVENKFPASVMLGHCIAPSTPSPMHPTIQDMRQFAIEAAFHHAGLNVEWDGTDEMCVEVLDPLGAVHTFVRRASALKIAAFIKTLPFFERAMRTVWKPGSAAMRASMSSALCTQTRGVLLASLPI